jgi:Ca-activated chloride channel family protein
MILLWPVVLVLLLLVPVLVGIYIWVTRHRARPAVRYSSLSLVVVAQPGSSRVRRHLPFGLFLAAVVALVVALARPVAVFSVPAGGATILLTMDVSGSMCSTDIEPSRLLAAEAAASDFIQQQPAGTRIGIVAFSGFAELVQAPTSDKQALLDAVHSLTTGRRTAVGSGILAAIDAIADLDPEVAHAITDTSTSVPPTPVAPGDFAPAIIVVLTDGASNAGTDPAEAAQQAADRGVRVYTIGFGTAEGGSADPACRQQFIGREPNGGGFGGGGGGQGGGFGGGQGRFRRGIDEDTLKQVAQLTGGQYYPAESASELQSVFQGLPASTITAHEVVELRVVFAGIGALLTLLAVGLSQRWRPMP